LIEPSDLRIGYCTNVHAGRDFSAVCQNIEAFCIPIRRLVEPDGKIGVGLWFSEQSAKESIESRKLTHLKGLLENGGLVPFTLNGFPQGDFHSPVVKHKVYQPEWWTRERFDYTLNLIELLDGLLPSEEVGSISTLPIGWGSPTPSPELIQQAASHLLELADHLHRRFEASGRKIVIAIEPEPGCFLSDSNSFRNFYTRYLSAPAINESRAAIAREFLTLCHDICHAAVMFEDQETELAKLAENGLGIGKVQVSSAIQVIWDQLDPLQKAETLSQLSGFAEDRYLHQTNIRIPSITQLHEDLPQVLRSYPSLMPLDRLVGEWRIHFHVPIYLQQFGTLRSTQFEITKFIQLMQSPEFRFPTYTGHLEIETYAWGVLPIHLRSSTLQDGIAKELLWFKAIFGR